MAAIFKYGRYESDKGTDNMFLNISLMLWICSLCFSIDLNVSSNHQNSYGCFFALRLQKIKTIMFC